MNYTELKEVMYLYHIGQVDRLEMVAAFQLHRRYEENRGNVLSPLNLKRVIYWDCRRHGII